MIKILPLELVMTVSDTFPMTPGMAPKELANRLQHTLYWLHSTKKWEFLSHIFSLARNPSEAGVAVLHSRVLLWVPRNPNFCLTNLLWHILSSMLSSSSSAENVSTVYPVFSLRCHSPRQEEVEDASTAEASSHPESHLQWLPPLHMDKERPNGWITYSCTFGQNYSVYEVERKPLRTM